LWKKLNDLYSAKWMEYDKGIKELLLDPSKNKGMNSLENVVGHEFEKDVSGYHKNEEEVDLQYHGDEGWVFQDEEYDDEILMHLEIEEILHKLLRLRQVDREQSNAITMLKEKLKKFSTIKEELS